MALRRAILACFIIASIMAHGTQASELRVNEWLQAPAGFVGNLRQLHGKVVVLEFWATWCAPCVAAIPHLNELASAFRNAPVVFLAITDDDRDRLSTFLTKEPIRAIIGIDADRKNWARFGVSSLPNAVLIGKDGNIIGSTLPDNITAEVLRDAISGRNPSLPSKEGIESDLDWDETSVQWQDGIPPATYAIIKPIKTTTAGAWPRPGHITADGVPLQVLVELAYATDHYHLDWQMPKDSRTYRAAFRVPAEQDARLLPFMRETLAQLFGVHASWIDQKRDVYVLRRIDRDLTPSKSQPTEHELVEMRRGRITLRKQPVNKLCDLLANSLDRIVLDETGLEGTYNFDLSYQPGNPEVTTKGLNQSGLDVVKQQRTVRVLLVTGEKESARP